MYTPELTRLLFSTGYGTRASFTESQLICSIQQNKKFQRKMMLTMYLTSNRRLCKSIAPQKLERVLSEASGNTTSLSALPTGILEDARSSVQVMMTPFVVRWFVSIVLLKLTLLIVWDIRSPAFKINDVFPCLRPFCHISHNCQTVNNGLLDVTIFLGANYTFQGKMADYPTRAVESKS